VPVDPSHHFNRRFEIEGVLLPGGGLMPNKRGNPNWGRSGLFPPAMATEFEMQAQQLHLAPDQYVASSHLRNWCERNKNQHYIPEWLLKAWNISVNSDLTGAA
jgi:hypothetical protein